MATLATGSTAEVRGTLTRHGYGLDKATLGDAVVAALKKELTVSPKVNPNVGYGNAAVPTYPVFLESDKRFYLPRALGLSRYGAPAKDAIGQGQDALGLAFAANQELRPAQREAVAAFAVAAADPRKRGGMIVVGCGGGKTVMAIHIACSLGKRTLIVAHKAFLLEQWRERLAQYAPTASVGIIKQAKVDVEGRDVVLASLQSLAMREYAQEALAGFGLVVIDECHHVAAEVFSRALPKITSAVALGLSATPDRKDGLSRVIEWFLGPPCYVGERRTDSTVEVRRIPFVQPKAEGGGTLEGDGTYGTEHMIGYGRTPRRNTARMVNDVAACGSRNAFLVKSLVEAMAAEPERRALVLSERREHLKDLERRLRAAGFVETQDIGYYVGGMKQAALATAAEARILLATYQMASEAMDVPGLTMLLMASPFGDVNQSVGRVRRRAGLAIVIDVLDDYGHFINMSGRRARWYRAEKFVVVNK